MTFLTGHRWAGGAGSEPCCQTYVDLPGANLEGTKASAPGAEATAANRAVRARELRGEIIVKGNNNDAKNAIDDNFQKTKKSVSSLQKSGRADAITESSRRATQPVYCALACCPRHSTTRAFIGPAANNRTWLMTSAAIDEGLRKYFLSFYMPLERKNDVFGRSLIF